MPPLNEADAQLLCLARAIEDAGGAEGQRLGEEATQRARRAGAQGEALLVARAEGLVKEWDRTHPGTRGLTDLVGWPGWLPWVPWVVLLLIGLGLDALGGGGRINLLSVPILGLILWNGLVLIGLLAWKLFGRDFRGTRLPRIARLAGLGRRLGGVGMRLAPEDEATRSRIGLRLVELWRSQGARLTGARVAILLHGGAAFLLAGVLVGMYLRGLALDYRAAWQSTFLDADGVHRFLSVVLGPASALLHLPIELESVQSMRESAGGSLSSESAGPWIHRYAVTALLFVFLPRSILVLWRARQVRQLSQAMDLGLEQDPYFLRLSAAERGEGQSVWVAAYSFAPPPRSRDSVKTLVLDLFGSKSRLEWGPEFGYGAEDELVASLRSSGADQRVVLLFNLAQTPEDEVHGHLLKSLTSQGLAQPLVLLDASSYQKRFQGEDRERRIGGRLASWERMAREHGVTPLCVILDGEGSLATSPEAARRALEAAQRVTVESAS